MPISLWEQQARQWSQLKPPGRPSAEDLVWAQDTIGRWWQRQRRAPKALVLGATPELASLRWPGDSEVTAVDLSPAMLQNVWLAAPPAPGKRSAVQGNWLNLPFNAGSFDLVFGDGSFSSIRCSQGRLLAQAIRRLLRPEGELNLRAYVRPNAGETPESVCEKMRAGRIGNFQAFKFRLLMALHHGDGEVRVADAWQFFHTKCPPAKWLAEKLGWPTDEVTTIESFRDQDAIYWFPTLAEFRRVLEPDFTEASCRRPTYELGERCPTFVLRPRG